MRVVKGRGGTDALKLSGTDFNGFNTHVIVKFRGGWTGHNAFLVILLCLLHINYHILFDGEKENGNIVERFDSDGVEIAYQVIDPPVGKLDINEPILLIHGFASNGQINWVSPGWVKFLGDLGRQVILIDNRGHGHSEKLYDADVYGAQEMAADCARLLDHLNIEKCDIMGYSMGARISAFLTIYHPERVRSVVLAGMAHNMVRGFGRGDAIAQALLTDDESSIVDPEPKAFRRFAEKTGSDLKALAACMLSTGHKVTKEMLAGITAPVLVVAGEVDDVAGPIKPLVAMLHNATGASGAETGGAKGVVLPRRDHMNAVGDRGYKEAVQAFLESRN